MSPPIEALVEMYCRMQRIRQFEEAVIRLQAKGEILGGVHTSIGQEGEIVGACAALERTDYMVGNHRSHGHPIGKGAELRGLMAELLGRVTGVNRGKGGSMHLADFSVGSLGETSIVGSGIPVAAGAGLGSRVRGDGRVTLCFFGDGASNEGAFHEGLNLAAIWDLPVIYLCENNQYSSATLTSTVCAVEDIAERAAAYAMPGRVVDGQDVVAVYEAVAEAVARARAGDGPTLVEAKTYRFNEHAEGIRFLDYREAGEIDRWRARDPLVVVEPRLREAGVTAEQLADIREEVADEVADAVAFALESPYPERGELDDHLYANPLR